MDTVRITVALNKYLVIPEMKPQCLDFYLIILLLFLSNHCELKVQHLVQHRSNVRGGPWIESRHLTPPSWIDR